MTETTLEFTRPTSPHEFHYIGDCNVEYGGMFFDVSNWRSGYVDVLRITDLSGAVGATGMVLLEKLTTYPGEFETHWTQSDDCVEVYKFDRDKVDSALQCCGWLEPEVRVLELDDKWKTICEDANWIYTDYQGRIRLAHNVPEATRKILDEEFGVTIPPRYNLPNMGGDRPAHETWQMLIAEALVSYGYHDPDSDYRSPDTYIVQTETDGIQEFDGWTVDETLEEDQDLFDWLLDNDWLQRF